MKKFELSDKEIKRAKKFKKKQIAKNAHTNSTVSRWSYIITPGSIGVNLTIQDNIELDRKDITDYDLY